MCRGRSHVTPLMALQAPASWAGVFKPQPRHMLRRAATAWPRHLRRLCNDATTATPLLQRVLQNYKVQRARCRAVGRCSWGWPHPPRKVTRQLFAFVQAAVELTKGPHDVRESPRRQEVFVNSELKYVWSAVVAVALRRAAGEASVFCSLISSLVTEL